VRRHVQLADDLKLFDLREMEDLLGRTKGHRGQAKVRAALELYDERPVFTRSDLERRFLEVVREAGLPEPSMNMFVAGYEIAGGLRTCPGRERATGATWGRAGRGHREA
jgi:hypothetical protein